LDIVLNKFQNRFSQHKIILKIASNNKYIQTKIDYVSHNRFIFTVYFHNN
jgi:hypothetical protein